MMILVPIGYLGNIVVCWSILHIKYDYGGVINIFLYSSVCSVVINFILYKLNIYPKLKRVIKNENLLYSFIGFSIIICFFANIITFNRNIQANKIDQLKNISSTVMPLYFSLASNLTTSYIITYIFNHSIYFPDLIFSLLSVI